MDLKGYYRRLQEMERQIEDQDVYVVSLATPDGGREGVITQVPRRTGCQLVLDGKARVASREEVELFELEAQVTREALAEADYNSRIHVHLVTGRDAATKDKG